MPESQLNWQQWSVSMFPISEYFANSSNVSGYHPEYSRFWETLPRTSEPVLLGAAMLGAVAGGAFDWVRVSMGAMSAIGRLSEPTAPEMSDFHRSKRHVHECYANCSETLAKPCIELILIARANPESSTRCY